MKQIALRFPSDEVMPRVERLREVIRADAEFDAFRLSNSGGLRMALLLGLEQLEIRHLGSAT